MMVESLPSSMTGRVEVDLALEDAAWLEALPDAPAAVELAGIAALDHVCPGPQLSMAVVLTNDEAVRALNARWRGQDKATNVLSFPAEDLVAGTMPSVPSGAPRDLPIEIGDVVLARETVLREAEESGVPARNHLCHLVVHGSLHLLGYDHEEEDDAVAMEALESQVLSSLGIPNPYA
jgi:probable rRNA maturation factor